MAKSTSSKKSSKKSAPTLSATQVKEITDYIQKRKSESAEPKVIRKEVFKKFGIDTTQWELNWGSDAKTVKGSNNNHRVAEGQQLLPTKNITKRHEPVSFRYEFSPEELQDRGGMLAQLEIDRDQLEEEKKNVASEFKAKIEEKETQISKVAREVNSGFEMRNETCEVIRDFEACTRKTYYRGKLVKDEKLAASDYTLFATAEEDPIEA